MSPEKTLHRIQLHIDELTPMLELFVDTHVQPSVHDCESLQKLLNGLQESIAVYKYHKQNKEISPSFNIHAHVSQKEAEQEKKAELVNEIKETVKLEKEEKIEAEHIVPETKKEPEPKVEPPKVEPPKAELPKAEPTKHKVSLAVGINDKFRFINELFSQNNSEYSIAIEQINNLSSWGDAELYLNSLKNVYGWNPKNEVVSYFFGLVKKRFE